ncbi:MAG: 4Fe-4S binding protein [Candidatus Omnitrophota bacterium]
MKYKKSQLIMIWFLPVIVIGGWFFPMLGYIMVAMIAFFLTLAVFRGRYWCWNLCPRGSFLDIVMLKFSPKKSTPKAFTKLWFRGLIFTIFTSFLIFRIIRAGGELRSIGAVFVSMCLVTTIISIVLGELRRNIEDGVQYARWAHFRNT